jgi:hypothetical protein
MIPRRQCNQHPRQKAKGRTRKLASPRSRGQRFLRLASLTRQSWRRQFSSEISVGCYRRARERHRCRTVSGPGSRRRREVVVATGYHVQGSEGYSSGCIRSLPRRVGVLNRPRPIRSAQRSIRFGGSCYSDNPLRGTGSRENAPAPSEHRGTRTFRRLL